ncbi:sce7726 family protein [Candidatus Pantoea multigeneris]|uniref:Sce7726 family protein n=1 Tax=Candidatus Pantoea multigeneris TaxID=2608357 RepID=A0ABX0RGD7_9GAMM|nr:sce7726 family protein [Pantoea multigeneris]NIF22734.1 sce7726 family protein [Pantoea multigeneris]
MGSISPTQDKSLSKMFSASLISEIARKGKSASLAHLLHENDIIGNHKNENNTIGDAFNHAFNILRKSNSRGDYIYRSALIRKSLSGRNPLKNSTYLPEFRIGLSKADMVIINETASVYEIKSEIDSLSRLAKQIGDYQKAFAKVFVIAGESHINNVMLKAPDQVGVLKLDRRNKTTIVRDASFFNDALCSTTMFESLRVSESSEILRRMGIDIPSLPNTLINRALKDIFSSLNAIDVNYHMVSVLKKTRNLAPLNPCIKAIPDALQALVLMMQLRNVDRERLIDTLNKPIEEALTWG